MTATLSTLADELRTLAQRHEQKHAAALAIDGDNGHIVTNDAGICKPFASYPGGKDAAGSAERIVAALPAHGLYVEAFLGGGSVLRRKTPALHSIGIDADPLVIDRWKRADCPGLELIHGDAIAWLARNGPSLPADALVNCDPPYMLTTRTKQKLYRVEMTDTDHADLLAVLNSLPCSVAISGYDHQLYREALKGWTHHDWQAMTRGGVRTEHLWVKASLASFNGAARYAGDNFRARERIKRKCHRWRKNFAAMPKAERDAVLRALLDQYQESTNEA